MPPPGTAGDFADVSAPKQIREQSLSPRSRGTLPAHHPLSAGAHRVTPSAFRDAFRYQISPGFADALQALGGRNHLLGARASPSPRSDPKVPTQPHSRCSPGSTCGFGIDFPYTYCYLFFFFFFLPFFPLKPEARNSIATRGSQGLTPAL